MSFASASELASTEGPRRFDAQKMEEYQADVRFDYSTDYALSDSLVTLFLAWLLDVVGSFFKASGMVNVWPYLFGLLVIGVIVAVIYYILKNRYGSIWERETKTFVPMGVAAVAGQQVDYDELIKESRHAGEYKLAIRYLFLKCLHELHQAEQVHITTWKAPLDYVRELSAEKQGAFTALANLFEVAWYGDYDAQEDQFLECHQLVETIRP